MNEFEELEKLLRDELRRREPSPGFAERVAARAAAGRRRPVFPMRAWMAVAAAVLMVLGGLELREYQRGQEAKRQLLTALSITAEKLNAAGDKIEHIQRRHGHDR